MQELWQPMAARPGELWFIEHCLSQPLAAGDRDALTAANVVLYQRALAPLVASVLPLGSYAEPLPTGGDTALSPRAMTFAGEGWSVAQLVENDAAAEARLQRIDRVLNAIAVFGDLPVQVIIKPAMGGCREVDVSLRTAFDVVCDIGSEGLLTLVFGPLPLRLPVAAVHAFTANGLAG
ncbi:MAG TPA: hypothetical protein VHU15_18230 [Stellaceae bacterium]|nr:hypothetical protein [Stellaceae bacterium]